MFNPCKVEVKRTMLQYFSKAKDLFWEGIAVKDNFYQKANYIKPKIYLRHFA